MTAVTTDAHQVRLELRKTPQSVRGRDVILVDTPGFNHTDLSDSDVQQRIESTAFVLTFDPSSSIR